MASRHKADHLPAPLWSTFEKYREALRSKDMIDVSEEDVIGDDVDLDSDTNDDQPEGVDEKKAMKDQLMRLKKVHNKYVKQNKNSDNE